MIEFWTIIVLVFAATLLGVQAIYGPLARSRHAAKSTKRRLTQSLEQNDRNEFISALRNRRGLVESSSPVLRSINDLVMQSGVQVNRKLLVFAMLSGIVIFFYIWAFVFGRGVTSAVLAIAATTLITVVFFHTARERRIARFAELLPDSIDVLVRAIRVGYPLPAALSLVAREMPDPVGPEFGATAEEIAFGQDIRAAAENLYRRVGLDDLMFFIVAINVQTQTGGNLAEILARLCRLMRSRTKLQLKIQALSADGRISALVLSLMPFVLFAGIALIAPNYFAEVRNHPIVMPALAYGAISLIVGNIIMYRMVNFRF